MARRFCPDYRRTAIALIAMVLLSALATIYAQLIVIVAGAALGLLLCRKVVSPKAVSQHTHEFRVSRPVSAVALTLFCALLFGLLHAYTLQ